MTKKYLAKHIPMKPYVKFYALTDEGLRHYTVKGSVKDLVEGKHYTLLGIYNLREFEHLQKNKSLDDLIEVLKT